MNLYRSYLSKMVIAQFALFIISVLYLHSWMLKDMNRDYLTQIWFYTIFELPSIFLHSLYVCYLTSFISFRKTGWLQHDIVFLVGMRWYIGCWRLNHDYERSYPLNSLERNFWSDCFLQLRKVKSWTVWNLKCQCFTWTLILNIIAASLRKMLRILVSFKECCLFLFVSVFYSVVNWFIYWESTKCILV